MHMTVAILCKNQPGATFPLPSMCDSPLSPPRRFIFPGVAFIIGMAVFGLIVRHAVMSAKKLEEFVTVKGLSEREVAANLAIWPIAFVVMENDLTALQQQIAGARGKVQEFLTAQGFSAEESSQTPPQIQDLLASGAAADSDKPQFRYRANITVLLRTEKVPQTKAALEKSDRLVQAGIVLTGGEYTSKPQFLFTLLNAIKPEMIGEANRNARKAAAKFAEDSQAQIGAIKHAVQGPFEINDVDPSTPDRKTVRVVTTVDFYLQ